MNKLQQAVLELSTAPWDWNLLSANPSITFDFITTHPELPWNKRYVSRNISITEGDIRGNLSFGWDLDMLCSNPNLSMTFFNEFIIKPTEFKNMNWLALSSNPSMTLMDIESNKSYKWNDKFLSSNPNITSNYILNEGKVRKWFAPSVSSNKGITYNDIFKGTLQSVMEWDYKNLSANPNLPIKYVSDHPEHPWNYHTISCNTTLVDIEQYHNIPWDIHGLSMNTNITLGYVISKQNLLWDLSSLLSNDNIAFNDIQWITERWNNVKPIAEFLSSNRTITIDWIKKNQRQINWNRLSQNIL